MKITSTIHTTIDAKATWYRLDALKAAFPKMDVDYVDQSEDGKEGYTFIGDLPKDFKAIVEATIEKADDVYEKKNNKTLAKHKAAMSKWVAPVPSTSQKKLVKSMDTLIANYIQQVNREISEGQFDMAVCYAGDIEDFVEIRDLIEKDDLTQAYKTARLMDTCPRDSIPRDVYDALIEAIGETA